jgi:NAD+ synthase (glutamine-hydrolysing)
MKRTAALRAYLKEGGRLGSLGERPPKRPAEAPFPCDPAEVFGRQVDGLALRLKRLGAKAVAIGVSGGLDSTLCLLVAVAAFDRLGLGRRGVHAVSMPGFGTSRRTKGNGRAMCEGLGVSFETIDIRRDCRRHLATIGHDGVTPDVTFENAQARMRTLVLMDKANLLGALVLGTGDMSEIALGWCTYNGDHMSMFAVNSGVPKTVVRAVCSWWAAENASGPLAAVARAVADVVATPVSPELVKGQRTEETIGPYELHDFFIWNFVVNGLDRGDLLRAARRFYAGVFPAAAIARTLDVFLDRLVSQAFKRNCHPDGIRVFPFDFSRDSWSIPSDLPRGIL